MDEIPTAQEDGAAPEVPVIAPPARSFTITDVGPLLNVLSDMELRLLQHEIQDVVFKWCVKKGLV